MIDIVIISDASKGEGYDLTSQTIQSLIDTNIGLIKRIIVVESDLTANYNRLNINELPITIIRPTGDFNYNSYLNQGIKATKSKYIALCNNDLIFEKNWDSSIIDAIKLSSRELGLPVLSASPFCPNTQGKTMGFVPEIYLSGYEIRKHISGWCILIDRSILSIIGKLPEEVDFWFSDNLYADKLRKMRLTHILSTRSFVTHYNSGSNTLKSIDGTTKEKFTTGQQTTYNKEKDKLFPAEKIIKEENFERLSPKNIELKDSRYN